MDKKKLIIARNKIDQLDNSIFNLIKKRTKVVKHMLGLKRYKNQIVDHKRINTILKNIRKKSMRHRIDPKITTRIWKAIIWSYVYFQKKILKRNNYLLCGGNFFSTKNSCFLVAGLYFFTFNFTFAFSPELGFFT